MTTPLDVVKTLLNTQETGIGVTRGMKGAILQVANFRISKIYKWIKDVMIVN